MEQTSQRSPATSGVLGTPGPPRPVQSQALQQGTRAFLELLRNEPTIRQFVLQSSGVTDNAAQAVKAGDSDSEAQDLIQSLQHELKILREELASTKKTLADTQRELQSMKATLLQKPETATSSDAPTEQNPMVIT